MVSSGTLTQLLPSLSVRSNWLGTCHIVLCGLIKFRYVIVWFIFFPLGAHVCIVAFSCIDRESFLAIEKWKAKVSQ